MPSIVQVGFTALTIASTALASLTGPYGNTTVHLPTGYVPTGYVPTGYVPTGGSTSSSISAPYGNSTTTHRPTTPPTLPSTTTTPGGGHLSSTTSIGHFTTTTRPGGPYTTSTVYTTIVQTITACPPIVTKCPYGEVITKTIPLYTTVCPITTEAPVPTYTVVPVPPEFITTTTIVTDVHTVTRPSGEEYVTSRVYTSVVTCPYTEVYPPHTSTGAHSPVAPYPTKSTGPAGPIGTGTGTGAPRPTTTLYRPEGVLTLSLTTQPRPTFSPPLEHNAAGKLGVSSAMALVLASVFALMY